MRDLYNRKARLERWIHRIHTELQDNEPDKQDILKFVDYLQEKDKSILWIVRCITALLQLKKEIKKPFCQLTKEDIKKLFEWMNNKGYKASTHEKFRVILKVFYKVIYGNNEVYPDCVKWFSVTVGKEIKSYCNTIVRDNVTVTLTLKNKNKINNKIINIIIIKKIKNGIKELEYVFEQIV